MRPWMFFGALLLGGPALAQDADPPDWADKTGAVGVGANTSLGGVNGLNVRTFVTPQFGLALTFGFGLSSTDVDPSDVDGDAFETSDLRVAAGLYGSYKLAFWERGHLSALFGADVATSRTSFDSEIDVLDRERSSTDLLLGLGLQGEWFPTQYLSLFGQVGLRLDFLTDGDDTVVLGDSPSSESIAFSVADSTFGNFGFTVWFK